MEASKTLAGHIGELKAWALIYADEHSLTVFPVNPANKTPLTSQYQATVDIAQVEEWWTRWPTALIGHRLSEHHVILDIDPRHNGLATWKALKAELGDRWPTTRAHKSGRNDQGGHTWWLRPDDDLAIGGLDDWAREHGTGHQVPSSSRWTAGIDLLHHTHRYTILPPSPHPETAKPYYWQNGLEVPPAPMPALLADLLTNKAAPVPARRPAKPKDPDSIADWWSAAHTWSQLLEPRGWTLRAGDGDTDGSRWRHPSATSAFSATVKHGLLFVYSPNTAFEVTEPGHPVGYTRFRAWATLEHGGDLSRAALAAREAKDGAPVARLDPADLLPRTAITEAAGDEADRAAYVPDVVWDSRPRLAQIRQAARAQLVAPDAVLGAVLVRVAALTPHVVELPGIVGSPVGLSFFAGLVGTPESGKSAAVQVAGDLLPAPAGFLDRLPIGSGEGMVEVLFDFVEDVDDNGRKRKVKTQTRRAAIFHIDEGQALADLSQRTGSTLMPTLRSAWTHGTLGNANASMERKRILDGTSYVYGVTLGIQPELAGPLMADVAGGTPQRFAWFMATDPDVGERPVWPGELDWAPLDPAVMESYVVSRRGFRRVRLAVLPDIEAEVVADRQVALSGKSEASGDAHRGLLRLKVAALLALLDDRAELDMEDWHLADLVCDSSRAVRQSVEATLDSMARSKDRAATMRRASAELLIEDTKASRALESASRSAARVVARHAEAAEHGEGGGCSKRCVSRSIAGKHRAVVSVDEVLALAVDNRWMRVAGEQVFPGISRPS